MITPPFTLSQTSTHLLIEIRTPHIKVHISRAWLMKGARCFALRGKQSLRSFRDTILSAVPHTRKGTDSRLTLPGNVVEDDESSAKYDIASGILSISLSKVNIGEEFPDLDLTNRLLARTGEIVDDRGQVKGPPRIQVMDTIPSGDPWTNGAFDEALLFDFQLPQTLPDINETVSGSKYGFNNQYAGHFVHIQNPDVLTIPAAEQKTALERWQTMRHQEDEKFDRDWYLADLFEPPDNLTEILEYKLPESLKDPFSAEEQLSLRNLGNKDCTPQRI
jgi:protein SHQ1